MAGAKALDIPIEIKSEAENIMNYGFILSNGDRLIALWSDIKPVSGSMGTSSKVTLLGDIGKTVKVIDVLHGVEQESEVNLIDGDIIIEDLMIKDYPIILRLSP